MLSGTPTHFIDMLAAMDQARAAGKTFDLSAMRNGLTGGAPLPPELMKRMMSDLHMKHAGVRKTFKSTNYNLNEIGLLFVKFCSGIDDIWMTKLFAVISALKYGYMCKCRACMARLRPARQPPYR